MTNSLARKAKSGLFLSVCYLLMAGLPGGLMPQALANQPTAAQAPATQPATAHPTPYRFLLISIDGLRPDLMLQADAPTLHSRLKESAYSLWARTTAVAITLPSHTSMVTGVQPQTHGIMWNEDLPFATPVYPKVPTLFELAKKSGYTTALVAGKSKFDALAKPGTVDWIWVAPKSTTNDDDVAEAALKILRVNRPEVMMVHFPGADNTGHARGWSSPEQMAAIKGIDRHVTELLSTLKELGLDDNTYVLITADHGGSGKTHGAEDTRSRIIPWILSGPNIRKGYDLTQIRSMDVNTEDTFATACYLLKIPTHPKVEGKVVLPAFQDVDLMKPSANAK